MSQTPLDLIKLAGKAIGAIGQGQILSSEEANTAFSLLQMMLASWQTRRWDVYQTQDVSVTSTGAQSYVMGPGGDFNIVRPVRVDAAFVRQQPVGGLPVDYPLTPLMAREDYNRIGVKNIQSFPQCFFYDGGYPSGNLFVWPIPQASLFQIHCTVLIPLQQFATLQDTFQMPDVYREAILWNLAIRLGPIFGVPVSEDIKELAKGALNTLKTGNTQIGQLTTPASITRPGWYSVYSDQGR